MHAKILLSMRLGVHVPIAGGLREAFGRARRLSCTTIQIFSRSPRSGAAPPLPLEDVRWFQAQRYAADIEPLAVHCPYIINLASPEAAMWRQSVRLYCEEYLRTIQLGAAYLVTHVGSHKGQGESEGIARVSKAVSQALDTKDVQAMILLENTAGSGQGLGYQFEQLAAIREQATPKERVGICLDTAHLFAAGYPIHTKEGLEETLNLFQRSVGLEHVRLIHLNDSKVPFQSKVDRHWHIGEGHIGLQAFERIVNHSLLRDIPMVLETPKDSEADDQRNLATVRELMRDDGR